MTSALHVAHAIRREVAGKSFVESPYQWGKVAAVHTNPASVDLNLDGSATVTPTIRYLASYTPTVGDVVLVGRYGTDRVALGTLAK